MSHEAKKLHANTATGRLRGAMAFSGVDHAEQPEEEQTQLMPPV